MNARQLKFRKWYYSIGHYGKHQGKVDGKVGITNKTKKHNRLLLIRSPRQKILQFPVSLHHLNSSVVILHLSLSHPVSYIFH